MASQSEAIDMRCPSCKQQVQSMWKCCPFCETRLERPSCKSSTQSNLTERPHSQTDVIECDPQQSDSIDFGPACIEKPVLEKQPLFNADDDIGSDSLELGSDSLGLTVEEYLRDFEEALRKGGVSNISDFITNNLNKWRHIQIQINIAVIGVSGAGISSFINAIRGLRPGDEFYARTGVVATTTAIHQYPHPDHHNLVFWDLPGVGTAQFPKETYLRFIDIKKYDFFILVWHGRFSEYEKWLAKEIGHLEKKFYLVKSKIDIEVELALTEHRGIFKKADNINELRKKNTCYIYEETGLTLPKLFLVNNNNINEYDFKDLITQLMNDIPVLKKDALVSLSLAITVLDEKRKVLQKRELRIAIKASFGHVLGGVHAVHIEDYYFKVDIGAFMLEAQFYQTQFGINYESLKIISNRMNMSVDAFVKKLEIVSTSIV